jgi:methylenetetrahydrofolate dehydrogenase (NADP+)/methenyltetrahydrofolate cyclohydrolase
MTATIIDGKKVAAEVRSRLATNVASFTQRTGRTPGLATILVGEDPASEVYVANKRKAATAAGIADFHQHLPATATAEDIAAVIDALAQNDDVSGILLQLPLPSGLDSSRLIDRIPASKDVDGLTTMSAGLLARGEPGLRPCTPTGIITLLDSANVPIAGALAVVIGRSQLVGAPVAQLLLHRNATVVIAHSRTAELASLTKQADIVVAAAGIPALVTAEHVKPGAAIIDVGIHRTDAGLVGDVLFDEVVAVAGWITPVPGGVGPMTIATLLENTLRAAEAISAASDL